MVIAMERDEQLSLLNRAWIIAHDLIREHGKETPLAVDCERLKASIEHIEHALGRVIE